MTVSAELSQTQNAQRVLIYRLGSLGDTLVALPALHLVEQAFPNAERRMLTNFPIASKAAAASAILGDSGLVHSYERYTVGERNPLRLLALAWRIRRFKPDVMVYLAAPRGIAAAERDAKFFRLAGVKKIIGLPLTEDLQKNREDADGVFEPEAERIARTVAALGDARLGDPASWDLRLTQAETAHAAEVLAPMGDRPVLAVSVGTKMQAKDWERENWRAFLKTFAEQHPGFGLAMTGSADEREASEFAAEGWRAVPGAGAVVNLCGALTPRQSAAVFARAKLFVGHDSGPMHLAAAVGTPLVAIFAARNKPRVWFPYGSANRVLYHRVSCWGCGLEVCIEEKKRCILSITVEEAMAAVRSLMA